MGVEGDSCQAGVIGECAVAGRSGVPGWLRGSDGAGEEGAAGASCAGEGATVKKNIRL